MRQAQGRCASASGTAAVVLVCISVYVTVPLMLHGHIDSDLAAGHLRGLAFVGPGRARRDGTHHEKLEAFTHRKAYVRRLDGDIAGACASAVDDAPPACDDAAPRLVTYATRAVICSVAATPRPRLGYSVETYAGSDTS